MQKARFYSGSVGDSKTTVTVDTKDIRPLLDYALLEKGDEVVMVISYEEKKYHFTAVVNRENGSTMKGLGWPEGLPIVGLRKAGMHQTLDVVKATLTLRG
jgi:hypothetical protein